MNLEEEKNKLEYQHKLEQKRIVHSKAWNLAIVILIAVGSHWVGAKYASDLRRDELEHQSALELKKHRQSLYYNKRFESYQIIDSLYYAMYKSYELAIHLFKNNPDTTVHKMYINRLNDDYLRFISAENKYRFFLSREISEQVHIHGNIFFGILKSDKAEWIKYKDFIEYISRNESHLFEMEFISLMEDTIKQEKNPIFYMDNLYQYHGLANKQYKEYMKELLNTYHERWKNFMKENNLEYNNMTF